MSRLCWKMTVLCALVGLLAACGDNSGNRKLVITDPADTVGTIKQLCLGDDHDTVLAGIQYTVVVQASGFAEGDQILLGFNGAAPDPQLMHAVAGGEAVFSNVSFPVGMVSLVAYSADGSIASDAVELTINTTPPVVSFTTPIGGATLQLSDDVDPNTAGIQSDLVVSADVEDGQPVHVTLTSPSGVVTALPAMNAVNKTATVRGTFVEQGTWQLRVDASTACGNPGFAVIDIGVGVAPTVPCVVEVTPTPISLPSENFPVLNAALDLDKNTPKFQAIVKVHSVIGNSADLSINFSPTSNGTLQVVDDGTGQGVATFPVDLDEGPEHIKAECRDKSLNVGASLDSVVFVDTIAPTCAITTPADNAILNPSSDIDSGMAGTQFLIDATITGTAGDTEGELASVTVGGAELDTSVTGGTISVEGTLNSPMNGIPIVVNGQDHAGNTCSKTIDVSYATTGCSLTWEAPTGVVTTDSSGSTPGVQSNVSVQVDAACVGKTVTLTGCDASTSSPLTATASGGTANFTNVTLCTLDSCPRTTRQCTASVTNDSNITTSITQSVTVETAPPAVTVFAVNPGGVCGGTMTAANDADGNPANGVQVQVQVASSATSKWVENPLGSAQIPVDGQNKAYVTLAPGANNIVGRATDDSGLTGTSTPCTVTLASLALSITSPTNGAILGPSSGTVSGSSLITNVCGFVGEPTTSTVLVTYDMTGANDVTAVIDNTVTGHWCANLTIPSGAHTIDATATSTSTNSGSASINVTVKLTPPDPPTNFTHVKLTRNKIQVGWTAPADGTNPADHCTVKQSNVAIPDAATWDALPGGTVVPGGPVGSQQSAAMSPLKTGRPWFFGVRCFDSVGNASALLTDALSVTLELTGGAAIVPTLPSGWNLAHGEFGWVMAGGDLNGDGYADLIVAAPGSCTTCPSGNAEGLVYVFLGSSTGIGTTPDFIIEGTTPAGENLGFSLTTVDWNHDGTTDLAIGAPFDAGSGGDVFIFYGGSTHWVATPGTPVIKLDTAADVVLQTSLPGAFMGFSMDHLDFDGDGRQDFVLGAPGLNNFVGGAFVVFGPATTFKSNISIPGDFVGSNVSGTTVLEYDFTANAGSGIQVPAVAFYGHRVAGLGKLGHTSPPSAQAVEDFAISPDPNDFSSGTSQAYSVMVFWGRAQSGTGYTQLDGNTPDESVLAPTPYPGSTVKQDRFGEWLGSIQDQNGDGRRELVIADYTQGSSFTGDIYMVPGGIAGNHTVGATFSPIAGPVSVAEIGSGLANPADPALGGDVDNDGEEDLVCTTVNGSNPARADVWFGGESPAATSVEDHDDLPGMSTPSAIVWIGDVNKDGFFDLAVSDSAARSNPGGVGSVQVLY